MILLGKSVLLHGNIGNTQSNEANNLFLVFDSFDGRLLEG